MIIHPIRFRQWMSARNVAILSGFVLALPLAAPALELARDNKSISDAESKAMAVDAVKEIVAVYQDEGIQSALERADELYLRLGNRAFFFNGQGSCRPPAKWMKSEIWREAQVRTGMTDPEWGLALFRWYDAQETGHSRNRWLTSANIHNCLIFLGRLGEAHLLVTKIEDWLSEEGLNTMTAELKDLDHWNTDLPEIRDHLFPVRYPNTADANSRFYPYIHFVVLNKVAFQAYSEGDWRRSAELTAWGLKYAKLYIEKYPDRVTNGQPLDLYEQNANSLARHFALAGDYELALEVIDEAISRAYGTYSGRSLDYARLYRETLLLKLGRSDPGAIARGGDVLERCLVNKHCSITGNAEMVVQYALLLERHGQAERAWDSIEEFESGLEPNNLQAFHHMRMGKIKLVLLTGRLENVEKWLLESLEYVRKRGLKIDEPELYELYAKYMAAVQHPGEAMQLINEARRLYRGLSLDYLLKSTDKSLAEYQAQAGGGNGSVEKRLAEVDLQPTEMSSEALPDQSAYGRFALSNPTTNTYEGTFTATGKVEKLIWDDTERRLTVVMDDRSEARPVSRELELLPGDQVLIDTVAINPGRDADVLSLAYKPVGPSEMKSRWNYLSSSEGVSKAFINASSVQNNPFYLVPIFHTLQRMSVEVEPITNFRFVASVKMRVEVYNSDTQELIYIDANGDGDLMGTGDQIAQDEDRDGQADHTFPKDTLTADVELYFHVPAIESDEPIKMKLQIKKGDQWETQCINMIRLKPGSTDM